MTDEKAVILREIKSVRAFLNKLSQGVDPTCDLAFETDTVLNNKAIQQKLQLADTMLNAYYAIVENNESASQKVRRRGSVRFMLPQEALCDFPYSDEPITISSLVYSLNGKYKKVGMRNLKATELTKWLEDEGYLRAIESYNGHPYKIPTEKGEAAGITLIEKRNSIGDKYYICLYDMNAQRFVLKYLVKYRHN